MEDVEIILKNTDIVKVIYHMHELAVKQGLKKDQEFYPQEIFPRVSHSFVVKNNQLVIEDIVNKPEIDQQGSSTCPTNVVIITAHPLERDTVHIEIEYLHSHEHLAQIFINDLREKFSLQNYSGLRDNRKPGKTGRPHWPEDIWAWEQVHINRRPLSQVYSEWIEKIESNREKRGELQDPIRQFNRITNRDWKTI